MRILVISVDVYSTVGGGETVYRRLIEAHSEIEFVYYRSREPADAPRPRNAKTVALRAEHELRVAEPFFPQVRLDKVKIADAFARSVAGEEFDIVEIPDYQTYGVYLRECLHRHGVRVRALVLAMHGNISVSLDLGWDARGVVTFDDRQLEIEQYRAVDARYAISKRYAAEWQARAGGEIHLVDPLAIAGGIKLLDWSPRGGQPSLYCIGRMERRKGNDLFLELVRWLGRGSYDKAFHVGSHDQLRNGSSSREYLEAMARSREVEVGFLPSQNEAGLDAIYRGDALVVLPVRYDSFNLVALEALMKGCPVAVSDAAGVCDYLDERFPDLPYVKIGSRNIYSAVSAIRAVLQDYGGYRSTLLRALSTYSVETPSFELRPFYEQAMRTANAHSASRNPGVATEYDEAGLGVRAALAVASRVLPA
ncbi:MAG: glycosyltransferase family 4 protein, partial [Alphaproteobacteria bacterium]|nr:glycosyltransferase family 4 protein [Alphaproteobacteria bacterium]